MGDVVVWKGGEVVGGTLARLMPSLSIMREAGDDGISLGPSSLLMSPDDARAIISESEEALKPCGREIGEYQASCMLAVFAGARSTPRRDEETEAEKGARDLYARAIATALSSAPHEVVKAVVADVVMTHRYGYPLPADITSRIEKIIAPIRRAADTARAHLREYERRAEKRRLRAEEDARVEADRAAVQAGFTELLGRLKGTPND